MSTERIDTYTQAILATDTTPVDVMLDMTRALFNVSDELLADDAVDALDGVTAEELEALAVNYLAAREILLTVQRRVKGNR